LARTWSQFCAWVDDGLVLTTRGCGGAAAAMLGPACGVAVVDGVASRVFRCFGAMVGDFGAGEVVQSCGIHWVVRLLWRRVSRCRQPAASGHESFKNSATLESVFLQLWRRRPPACRGPSCLHLGDGRRGQLVSFLRRAPLRRTKSLTHTPTPSLSLKILSHRRPSNTGRLFILISLVDCFPLVNCLVAEAVAMASSVWSFAIPELPGQERCMLIGT